MTDCTQQRDPLKLARDGTSREQRLSPALDPGDTAFPLVDEHPPEYGMVFGRAYSAFLKYYNSGNAPDGDWTPFFSGDVSVLLAAAAIEDVADYRHKISEFKNFLNNWKNRYKTNELRDHLDYLFSCCVTLAVRLDDLKKKLPEEISLKKTLQILIRTQLAPVLKRLIIYRKAGEKINHPATLLNKKNEEKSVTFKILGGESVKFSELRNEGLSKDWILVTDDGAETNDGETEKKEWLEYYDGIVEGEGFSVYGISEKTTVFDRINHIATHNLFTSILDSFLKVYARTVSEAKQKLKETLTKWNRHEPHYALFLAFLRLMEYARTEINTLTGRHLDFYYREILRLKEKKAIPSKAHLLVELGKKTPPYLIKSGVRFKAGKDDQGKDVFFANDRDFVANQAKAAELKTVYQDGGDCGKVFAFPVANSDDGLGAELTSPDQSWHPFYNEMYKNGTKPETGMPEAEIGFAVASHYLWMAEGDRTVMLDFNFKGDLSIHCSDILCLFTAEEGWIEKEASKFKVEAGVLKLEIQLSGADPAVIPYLSKIHAYNFQTNFPILLVKFKNQHTNEYSPLRNVKIENINLTINVNGLKSLAVSNDFGPIDTSKPFQPYGPSPVKGNALIIGSKEVFQKKLISAKIVVKWLTTPLPYNTFPDVKIETLEAGMWPSYGIESTSESEVEAEYKTEKAKSLIQDELDSTLNEDIFIFKPLFPYIEMRVLNTGAKVYLPEYTIDATELPVLNEPDLTGNEFYSNTSRHGFVRLRLTDNFGQNEYQKYLIQYIKDKSTPPLIEAPAGPIIESLKINYSAIQTISLDSAEAEEFKKYRAKFFHITPFGQVEQHPFLKSNVLGNKSDGIDTAIYLFPQFGFQSKNAVAFNAAADFYIGITGLKPPQNLNLLFQTADGTADPLSDKPDQHIHWRYLCNNEWISFAENDVNDQTGGLINSGIITFSMPRNATDDNTLMSGNMHWIRASVNSNTDAVCRLRAVEAQALSVTFADEDGDSDFSAKVLEAGSITKLEQPAAAIKKITQPFASFGGRGKESLKAYYTRVSERLRHKDRAIGLWDYERLVLEAFPQIYKVKCLNHTQYGSGIYRELAPGHVTVVTIPKRDYHSRRNPLQPFTSIGLLDEIESFLQKRVSPFVKLHVKNPLFEEVRVECGVRLYEGYDETFYGNELKKAITRFLSPWAFPGGGNPSFNGKIYKSVLINFAEEQPYVDYVTDFRLFHIFYESGQNEEKKKREEKEKSEIEGTKGVSVLVSVPEEQHEITNIESAEKTDVNEKCRCEA